MEEPQKKDKDVFSITDFAKFSRTTRDTLLYYDSIGLLSPISRGKNKYRYYSTRQLAVVNLIRTLQALGMPLTLIKNLVEHRTPSLMDELLEHQIVRIDEKIDEWIRARKLLCLLRKTIHSAINVPDGITVEHLPVEAIVLGGLNDYSRGRNDYDALLTFYHDCCEKYPDLDMNYPVWAMFSQERIKARDWVWPDRYYFANPEGYDKKPAGLYAIGYRHGGYGKGAKLYERMLEYIDKDGLEICGPAYEEYPLNEISVLEEKDYLMRVMINVREKPDSKPPQAKKRR